MNCSQRLRIALYSHDTMGLGHMRRNFLIAQSFIRSLPEASVLMIAGAREASVFAMPTGVDCLTLPALCKVGRGKYEARNLEVDIEEIIAIREKTISAALEAFEPDVFIVDNVPRGVKNELNLTLEQLCLKGKTHCVLGLRDVLDEPLTLQAEWQRAGNEEAIHKYFEQIWIYGDPSVHGLTEALNLSPESAAKARYSGYLDQCKRLEWMQDAGTGPLVPLSVIESAAGKEHLVLCSVGGGQDGAQVAEAFVRAEFPAGYNGLLITGPFMPSETRRRLNRIAERKPHLEVIKHLTEPTQILKTADRVIAMGGYNTVTEILAYEKHALLVPRVYPRQEQIIRAERLHELGLIDYLRPEEATPGKISEWLARELKPLTPVRELVDMNGLERLPVFLQELLDNSSNVRSNVLKFPAMKENRYVA